MLQTGCDGVCHLPDMPGKMLRLSVENLGKNALRISSRFPISILRGIYNKDVVEIHTQGGIVMAGISSNYSQQLSLLNILNKTYSAANKSATAVATGKSVNSAADNPSVYAIGQKMDSRIGALQQASANTQTGSSMLKVADGAMSNTLEILTTMKERAIQAANSTLKDSDRAAIQKEFNQYIDQITDNSLVEYNGMALLNGSNASATKLTTQAFTNRELGTEVTGSTKLTDLTRRQGDNLGIEATDTITVSYVKDGKTYHTSYSAADTTLEDIFKNANQAGGGDVFDTTLGETAEIGTDTNGKTLNTVDDKNAITVKAATAGTAGAIAGFTISVTDASGSEKKSVNTVLNEFSESIAAADERSDYSLTLHVGADSNINIKAGLGNLSAQALGLIGSDGSNLSVGTIEDANAAITVIENAINKVTDQSTTVGALSSRLEYTYSNLTTETENLTAAMDTLLSADLAKAITDYVSNNTQQQAAQAMLAQSMQNSGWFLSLLS